MKISLLHPATFKLDGGAMFGIIPKPVWEKKIEPDQYNRINMSLRVVLIQTKNKNILIDSGIGDYHGEKFDQQFDISITDSPLKLALKNAGLTPDDITDIILTHLHFDHVGGLFERKDGSFQEIFPKAKLHFNQKHFEYSLNPSERDSGSFQSHYYADHLNKAIKDGRVNFINSEEDKIIDGKDEIEFKISFGHTPYMLHPYFHNYIYMADLVPMSHHIHIPWVMGYDIEPAVTTKYKREFYKFIMDKDLTMIFEHDIEFWGAKLSVDEKDRYQALDIQYSNKEACETID